MIQEPQSKNWIVIIVAIISATGLICAAIIGLGVPFAERYANHYFSTPQSSSNPNVAPTNQPVAVSTIIATEQAVNQINSSDDKWACVQQADNTQKSTWETCWRYIQIDNAGGISEATKENASAIEWTGPTDLSYTTIGQYHSDYISEWYAWALQNKPIRFCIDINSKVQVEGRVESISTGCYLWQRGAFMVEIP